MNGYRKMISDRLPETWDMALRYLKCRQRWIDLIYKKNLAPLNTNCMCSKKENEKMKAEIVKDLYKMSFWRATNIDGLLAFDGDLYTYWTAVNSWITWFSKNMQYIDSNVSTAKKLDGANEEIIKSVIRRFAQPNDLVDFIYNYKYANS